MKITIPLNLLIGDYLSGTIGLTLPQHGAYLLTMMAYWNKGGPLTKGELKDICRDSESRIVRFFTLKGGLWHHKRIDEEIKKAETRMKSFQVRSMLGVKAREKKRARSKPLAGEIAHQRAERAGASQEVLDRMVDRHG